MKNESTISNLKEMFKIIFIEAECSTPKDIAYKSFWKIIGEKIPEHLFYIAMDESLNIKKADDGNLGYYIKIKYNPLKDIRLKWKTLQNKK